MVILCSREVGNSPQSRVNGLQILLCCYINSSNLLHMVFEATRKVSSHCLPKECWQAFLPTKLILEITFYMFTTVSTKKVVSKDHISLLQTFVVVRYKYKKL